MKIKNKLVIGFSSLMVIMLVMTFTAYDRLTYMNDQLDSLYSNRYMKIKNSTSLRGEINDSARIITNVLQVQNQDYFDKEWARLESKNEMATSLLATIKSEVNTMEERKMLTSIEEANQEFLNYQKRVLNYLSTGDYQGANAYRISIGQETQDNLLDILNEMKQYQDLQIDEDINQAKQAYEESIQVMIVIICAGLLLGLTIILWVIPSIGRGLNTVNLMMKHFGKSQFDEIQRITIPTTDEVGDVARVFQEMSEDLQEKRELEGNFIQQQKDRTWLNANMARITELFHGINSLEQVSQLFISEFTPVLGGRFGAIYIRREENNPEYLDLVGSYAKDGDMKLREVFKMGEGLIGQAALDRKSISLSKVPDDYLSIRSGLGEAQPSHVLIYPIVFEDELLGVIELANFDHFTPLEEELLEDLTYSLGIILNNISGRLRVEELLRESQALTEELQVQSEELQSQQDDLRRSNENLEKQTSALRRSEDLLQQQQEELEHFNTELIARTRAMEEQVLAVEEKNKEIEKTKGELERHATQLAVTSKYKSQFLANMSHELRTPLNSLLILSQLLSENKEENLTMKQVEYAHTIHMSGGDLLRMIDEILDLSKVDAGKMEINRETVRVQELQEFVEQNFRPVAESKHIGLSIAIEEAVPLEIVTDGHRVKQILRNLLSNAFKFTSEGEVTFVVREALPEEVPIYLDRSREYLALSVEDSGIGIPLNKVDLVFEAFQQVDGTTSRKYGGTGLGLSISREISALLGGGISLNSTEGQGSNFILYLPKEANSTMFIADEQVAATRPMHSSAFDQEVSLQVAEHMPLSVVEPVEDDRENIVPGDKVMLIIEDDIHFVKILVEMSREHEFKTVVAIQGDKGLQLARQYLPDAIILDIQLPVMDGWSILNELKSHEETRHIPVHVISVVDDAKQGLRMGAIAFLRKPSSREQLEGAFSYIESYTKQDLKQLLVVEDDEIQRNSIIELIGHDDVVITAVPTGGEALQQLRQKHYDCMVLDLMLKDMTGFELLDQIRDDESLNDLPIIIYTGKELNCTEETTLRKYAESIIIKDVKSPERLLDETTLFLHRVVGNLPAEKRQILQKIHNKEELFEGKKILLVDDDVRNVFALSSVLEAYQMNVVYAENGREALEKLEEAGDIDLILMDMMMPEMDGYEAMTRIRQMDKFRKLPIIALTAKAMKEDRSKCIEAGASDYVKKPIQSDQLLSLMRVWLYS
ncbi:CheY-like chemotaxis protein/GAF domain-containing protein [Paenibacillus anaericanus]|uniref:response regulator n=1 Tax=Paenibacillus anaericanus TaxID=170367 RepID=UPI0027817CAB|nr:response regulator [Paenibacillus anaericanus]MDQ0091270.1 CheY-like chemotaxis protein/GAF domain-containing protein [Paenibacillus anaericanus]